jgi:RES domain-containing protein
MRAWRIATDAPGYLADDLTGAGAKITGGRWNRAGRPILYCADSPSLACLETLVHLGTATLPLNRYLVAIDIPDQVWNVREVHTLAMLPVGWDAIPAGTVSLDFGDLWLQQLRTAVLQVPSTVAPEDAVILINPLQRDTSAITAVKLRKWLYDPRLR